MNHYDYPDESPLTQAEYNRLRDELLSDGRRSNRCGTCGTIVRPDRVGVHMDAHVLAREEAARDSSEFAWAG